MIEVIKDKNGAILALITWQLLDENYAMTPDGKIFAILELFIHESLDGVKTMKHFNEVIFPQVPDAKWCVYYRDGKPKTFKRKHFKRMATT